MLNFYSSKKKFLPNRVSATVISILLLFLSVGRSLPVIAQNATPAAVTESLQKEQASFLEFIDWVSIDSNILARLSRFIGSEVDSIRNAVMADNSLPDSEKIKAICSLLYFIQELYRNLSLENYEVYDIPGAIGSYKLLLKTFLYHVPYEDILKPIGQRRSQLLANAFWQYDECALLEDIAFYKRVASSPDFILQGLEKNPGFHFADSLLLVSAANNPMKIASYMRKSKTSLQDSVRNKKNIYLKEIVSLSGDRNASELLPFIVQLAENRITKEEILEKRTDANIYFKLLVNTLQKEIAQPANSTSLFHTTLRKAIKERSLFFYVNQLNELHGAADDIRFASVKDLRIEDLYYIITSCEEELYTSSYLGLYRRLMRHFSAPSADSLFRLLQYDNFNQFIRMAANYNTLADFLSCMPKETAVGLLNRFMSGIESDTQSGLEKAMDIADSFAGFSSVPGFSMLIRDELQSNLDRSRSGQLYLGIRLYSILLEVFDMVREKNPVNKTGSNRGNNEILEYKALQNTKGEIIELVLFYGDEDGVASFNNFINLFKDAGKWKITKNGFWITIHSLSDPAIIIYANLPLDHEEGLDLYAQDSLNAYLRQQSAEPVILIHRGHSYHMPETLKKLQRSVKLAILGSCGGNNNIISIAGISPDAQIIVSKKMGSKFINDPMIDVINETLQHKKDLIWAEVWEKLRTRFRKDEFVLNLFNEYIPPSKNMSLFVLKLFNEY